MASRKINKLTKIDKTQFKISAASPEAQNAQANAKDNEKKLASLALGGVNKQLYDFVAEALQTSLGNILGSGTVEFEKLSQQVYSSIVEIVQAKSSDGEIVDSLLEDIDLSGSESTQTTSTGATGETTETVTKVPVEVTDKETTIEKVVKQTQEKVSKQTEVVHDKSIEKETAEHTIQGDSLDVDASKAGEKYQQDVDSAIASANLYAEKVKELRAKLMLALVYLRSQKLDIFKILAGADEDRIAIEEKQEEINLDYEEEMRKRKNQRKEFNRNLILEAEWFKKAFAQLGEEGEQEEPSTEEPAVEEPSGKKPSDNAPLGEKTPERPTQAKQSPEEGSEEEPESEGEEGEVEKPKKKGTKFENGFLSGITAASLIKRVTNKFANQTSQTKTTSGTSSIEKNKATGKGLIARAGSSAGKFLTKIGVPKSVVSTTGRVFKKVGSGVKKIFGGIFSKKTEQAPQITPTGIPLTDLSALGLTPSAEEDKKKTVGQRLKGIASKMVSWIPGMRKKPKPVVNTRVIYLPEGSAQLVLNGLKVKLDGTTQEKKPFSIRGYISSKVTKFKKGISTRWTNFKKRISNKLKKSKVGRAVTAVKKRLSAISAKLGFGLKKEPTKPGEQSKLIKGILKKSKTLEKKLGIKSFFKRVSKKIAGFLRHPFKGLSGLFKRRRGEPKAPKAPKPGEKPKVPGKVDADGNIKEEKPKKTLISRVKSLFRSTKRVFRRGAIKVRKVFRAGRRVAGRLWRGVKRGARRLWIRGSKVFRRIGQGVKSVAKKVFNKIGAVAKKIWGKIKEVAKKVWATAKKVAKKVAKAAYKVTKKVVASVYNAGTKAIVAVTKGIGTGLKAAGNAVTAIPFVGWIVGPILTGIGVGLTVAANIMKVAFKAIGKISSAIVSAMEKALKLASKAAKQLKESKGKLGAMFGGIASKLKLPDLGIGKFFGAIGKTIRGWTSKWYFNSYTKGVEKEATKLKFKPKFPKFKFRARWGSAKVKDESESTIKQIFNSSVGMVNNALNAGFSWIQNILSSLGSSMAGIIASIGQRIALIGTTGFRGFLKALFSPQVLIPLGIGLLIAFHSTIIPWITDHIGGIIKGVVNAVKWVFGKVWGFIKWIGKQFTGEGGLFTWISNQTNPKRKWSIAWIVDNIVLKGLKLMLKVFELMNSLAPIAGSAFDYGALIAGWPWPLIGTMVREGVKKIVRWLIDKIKGVMRSALSVIVPETILGIEIRRRVFDWLGLSSGGAYDVSGNMKPVMVDLVDAMERAKEHGTTINKLSSTQQMQNITPHFTDLGLPDLRTIHNRVIGVSKKNQDAINRYTEFIKQASEILTDPKKVSAVAPGFYGSEQVTEALFSVFFITDPLSGNVFSIIPRDKIPAVVTTIQNMVMSAKNDPNKLAEASGSMLVYFDYMNRGRSQVLGYIVDKYNKFMDELGSADVSKQRELASSFAQKMKNNTFVTDALAHFTADQISQVRENDTIASAKQISDKGNVKGFKVGGGIMSGGEQSLDLIAAGAPKMSARDEELIKKGYGNQINWKSKVDLGAMKVAPGEMKRKSGPTFAQRLVAAYHEGVEARQKENAWNAYKSRTEELRAMGKTEEEIAQLGYGRSKEDWSKAYDKAHPKTQKGQTVKANEKGGKGAPGKEEQPKFNFPKLHLKTPSMMKVSLPGLTRDVKEGSAEYELYQLGIETEKSGKKKSFAQRLIEAYREGVANRKAENEWNAYKSRTEELRAIGKTEEEIAQAGYGLSREEWEKRRKGEVDEPGPDAATQDTPEEAEEERTTGVKTEDMWVTTGGLFKRKVKLNFTSRFDNAFEPGGVLSQVKGKRESLDERIAGINAAWALPEIKELQPASEKPPKAQDFLPPGALSVNQALKMDQEAYEKRRKAAFEGRFDGTYISGDEKETFPMQGKYKMEKLFASAPKGEDMLPKPTSNDEFLNHQGISAVSEAQWVSAQEAHKLEQKIFSNAKDIRDIIEGLTVMRNNLDSAKVDLKDKLDELKRNPNGEVLNLPPQVVPAGLLITVPDTDPNYDPLPALVG